jgi:hypothetical protein
VLTLAFTPVKRAVLGLRLGPAGEAAFRPPASRGEGAEGVAFACPMHRLVLRRGSVYPSRHLTVTRSLIGCARMYASSASLSAAWGTLLARVSAASRVDLDVIEHAYPAPLDDLWARDDMGCVFMCGYPWALRSSRPRLLAAPAPMPPLVASPMIDADMCARLKAALLDAHRDPGLVSTLESLLLRRFVEATPSRFEVFLERRRAAESAGYTVLA